MLKRCLSIWKQKRFKESTLIKRTKAGKINETIEPRRYWKKVAKVEEC